jgi:putative chitinase
MGVNSISAIEEFQVRVEHAPSPTGTIEPDSPTLTALRSGIPSGFNEVHLKGIMISEKQSAKQRDIDKYFSVLKQKMQQYAIDTPLRIAHFLAQLAHESQYLTKAEEDDSGEEYEGNKKLGNTQPGDGKRFKGRGLIQLTGRANYKSYGDATNKDYTTDNNARLIATDSNLAVDVSCWFWVEHELNKPADMDDIITVTKIINGEKMYGLAERKRYLARAKFFLLL